MAAAPPDLYDESAMTTILVVDDEPAIVRLVRDYLERAGFEVMTAANGEAALQSFSRSRPDLVILDLTLPAMDGLDVARALRRTGEVPIIMLTARTEEADRVVGLELGADDYVTKPFSAREIVARVRAVLRRAQTAAMHEDIVHVGDSLVLDAPRMQVQVDGHDVLLTPTEFQLLLHMARQPGRLHARATARRGPRRRRGVLRASHRRTRQEHPPQDRARPSRAAPPSDRLRSRLPPCGRDRVSPGPAWTRGDGGRRPPWWPEGEAPPWTGAPNWRGHGRRVARRIGCFVGLVLLVLASAVFGVVWLLLSAFGAVNSAPFDTAVAVTALVLGGIAVAVAILVLRRLAAPVGALIEGAHRIETGDLSSRVQVRGPSDLRSLARAMNDMSGRLEAEETRRRSVLADIAHELRTPLSIIRGQAEAITDGIYPADAEHMAPIISATESLEMLVNDLSTLTLAESGALQLRREPIDVAVLVNATLDAFQPEAASAEVQLVEDVDANLPPIDADPARMRGVLGNLVTNALAHSRRGGTVRVAATASDGWVLLTVRDDGAGIPPELLPRIFDRFVKGPESRGSGLGLAIVRDVVEAHGGSVVATSDAVDGTAITLKLPVVARP